MYEGTNVLKRIQSSMSPVHHSFLERYNTESNDKNRAKDVIYALLTPTEHYANALSRPIKLHTIRTYTRGIVQLPLTSAVIIINNNTEYNKR